MTTKSSPLHYHESLLKADVFEQQFPQNTLTFLETLLVEKTVSE
ncbi:MAG: hypothetical protein AAFR77_13585 [Cyanobacteria bacterium J06631_2]